MTVKKPVVGRLSMLCAQVWFIENDIFAINLFFTRKSNTLCVSSLRCTVLFLTYYDAVVHTFLPVKQCRNFTSSAIPFKRFVVSVLVSRRHRENGVLLSYSRETMEKCQGVKRAMIERSECVFRIKQFE